MVSRSANIDRQHFDTSDGLDHVRLVSLKGKHSCEYIDPHIFTEAVLASVARGFEYSYEHELYNELKQLQGRKSRMDGHVYYAFSNVPLPPPVAGFWRV